jgi:hypothetical protein
VFLGDDLPAWLLLAFGGALTIGTVLALLRPPPPAVLAEQAERARQAERDGDDDRRPTITAETRPPLARSLVMITIGLLCAGWALASLIHGHG